MKSKTLRYYLAILLLAVNLHVFAQGTITTTFSNNDATGEVTFNFQNNNTVPVMITDLGSIVSVSGAVNVEAWYKTSAINGAPGVITTTNGWTQFATGIINGVANTTTSTSQNFFSGLSLVVPAGATYGICVSAYTGANTGVLRYNYPGGTGTTQTTNGNCIMRNGNLISYVGQARPNNIAPTFTPAAFVGTLSYILPSACAGLPSPGNTLSSADSVCSGNNIAFYLSTPPAATGITYQWQGSTNGTSWGIIPGATNSTYSTTVTTPVFYRCQVACGTNIAYSTAKYVNPSSFLSCYCTPSSTGAPSIAYYNISNVTFNTLSSSNAAIPAAPYYTSIPASTATTSVTVNNTYTLYVKASGNAYIQAWIDWNQNSTFEPAESISLGTTTAASATILSAAVTVPATAIAGGTKMRIRSGSSDACTSATNGETEDYIINIIAATSACTGAPSPGNTVSTADSICLGNAFTLSFSTPISNTGLTFQWQKSTDSSTWTNITAATSSTCNTSQTVATYYRCQVTCSGNTTISTPKLVKMKAFYNCYCQAITTDGNYGGFVTNVTFNTLNSTTGFPSNPPYFTAYASPTTTVYTQQTYTLSATEGGYTVIGAWMDWNHNGQFETTEYYQIVYSAVPGVYSTSVTIPATALPGNTRMRIRGIMYFSSLTSSDACTTYQYGETEEYTINVATTPACSGVPNAGDVLSSKDSVCSGSGFTLSLANPSIATGLTYQWQSSANGTAWANITGATNSTLSTTQTAATYYRCQVTCSGNTAAATAKLVGMSAPTDCYCIPAPSTNGSVPYNISSFSFNTLSYTSGPSSYPYYNNCPPLTTTTSVTAGSTYTIAATIPSGNSITCRAWIDWNQNGSFETTESYSLGTGTSGTLSTSVIVPATAVPGKTKLRIRSSSSVLATSAACTTITNGETEDYTIFIVSGTQCSGAPTPGNTIASTDSICGTATISLAVQNPALNTGTTYQWQFSTDGTNWNNYFNANALYYSVSQSATTWYRAEVSCGANVAYTTPALVSTRAYCYCIPQLTGTNGGLAYFYINTFNPVVSTNTPYTYIDSLTTTLFKGSTYFVQTPGVTNTRYLWFDWDQNGVFDASEYQSVSGNPFNITVPMTANTGKIRVRIRSNSTALGAADACASGNGSATDFDFNIMGASASIPLSITITDINVQNKGKANLVSWKTATELASDYFILERSLNGKDFTEIATLKAKGKSSSYNYYDEQPATGINYYRLKMKDAAGKETFSGIVQAVVKEIDNFIIEAFPNPVESTLNIAIHGNIAANSSIQLIDLTGKQIKNEKVTEANMSVSTYGLAPGIYLLKYSDNQKVQTIRIIKR